MADDSITRFAGVQRDVRDLEEIRLLRVRYARFVDLHDWSAWRDLLSEDYRLEAEGLVHTGRDAVVAFVSSALDSASSVHQVFAPDIAVIGPTTATGTWGYEDRTVFPAAPEPVVLHGYGYLTEQYVRTDAGWRIRSTREAKLQATDT